VARDGIAPPTQAFSGLGLLEPFYFAHEPICKTDQYNQPTFYEIQNLKEESTSSFSPCPLIIIDLAFTLKGFSV